MAQFFVPGYGMPPGMAQLLQEKYRQSGMISAAQANQANAAAALQQQQAGVVNSESAAKVRASDAAAYLDREKGGAIKPALQLDRDKFNVWRNDTNSNIDFRNAATEGQKINNRALPLKLARDLLMGEQELKYFGPRQNAEIEQLKSQSNLNNSGVGVNEKNARDPLYRPGDQSSAQPIPGTEAPGSTLATMDLSGSNNAWSGKSYQAAGPSPVGSLFGESYGGGMGAPMTAPSMGPLAAAPMTIVSPRRGSSSMLASLDSGGESLLDGSFLNNKFYLKRGMTRVPGKGLGDKVPAMLEPNEAVLNKHAADIIGRDKIAKANAKGNMQRQKADVGKVAQLLRQMGMA